MAQSKVRRAMAATVQLLQADHKNEDAGKICPRSIMDQADKRNYITETTTEVHQ